MIRALIIGFNDDSFAHWCLSSLVGYVDDIIAVVASWDGFAADPFNTDATIDILEKFGAKVIERQNITQVEQRNLTLNALKTNDWGIAIDLDETLYNPSWLNTIEDNEPDHYIMRVYNSFRKELTFPLCPFNKVDRKTNRLFKKTAPLHYHMKHYLLFRGYNCLWLYSLDPRMPEADTCIVHWRDLRSGPRNLEKVTYYKKRYYAHGEGLGFWSFWMFPKCWSLCKYWFGKTDFNKCVNIKWNKCNAKVGNIDTRRCIPQFPDPNYKEIDTWKLLKRNLIKTH
jgi:glycosyltransferase involved in cell wall biosynthesis